METIKENMVSYTRLIFALYPILCLAGAVWAQEDTCPAIVQAGLETVDQLCQETGRNQACYGNLTLTTESQTGTAALQFDTPGDIIDVARIQSQAFTLDDQPGYTIHHEWHGDGLDFTELDADIFHAPQDFCRLHGYTLKQLKMKYFPIFVHMLNSPHFDA
jgi:hypothetical protein